MPPQSVPNKTVSDALAELSAVRDEARVQLHLFSLDAKQRWAEFEAKILALSNSERPGEVALSSLREMTRAARDFVEEHRRSALATAGAIMTRNVGSCSPDESLTNAARVMWEADCGAVPVLDPKGMLLGVITDRDICMAAYTRGQPLWACAVRSVMSTPTYTCTPEDSVDRVAEIMRTHKVRRVPVVDADKRLVGMVSLADLARFVQSSGTSSRLAWFAETVASVSVPQAGPAAVAAQ
jgi:CBS domain-containing protein